MGLSNDLSCEAVSPAAAPTPTGTFNQRSEALFPRAGALGCAACFAPCRFSGLSICAQMNVGLRGATHRSACPVLRHSESGPLGLSVGMNVGPQGLLVVGLPALFIPHPASLGPATATRILSARAARLRPSYRSG